MKTETIDSNYNLDNIYNTIGSLPSLDIRSKRILIFSNFKIIKNDEFEQFKEKNEEKW